MNLLVRIVLVATLAWQALDATWHMVATAAARFDVGYVDRLTADTRWRMRRVLGPFAPLLDDIEARIPRGDFILWRLPAAGQGTADDLPRFDTGGRLRHLVYPDHFMTYGQPDPIGVAEAQARAGMQIWLLVLGDDPEPAGRPGWTREVARESYAIWRFQKA